MSFFTRLINIEDYLKRIDRLVRTRSGIKEIKELLKKISDYILYLEGNHKTSLHPNEIAQLSKAKNIITGLEVALGESFDKFSAGFDNFKAELNKPFELATVYLLRHPEKATEKSRSLSHQGVKQAKNFAEYLAEEILCSPKPVNVVINCSDIRRTYLFAEIIRKKLKQSSDFYNKNVRFSIVSQHPALFFRFSDAGKEQVYLDDYKKDENYAFVNWLKGKYKYTPDPAKVEAELEAWIREGLSKSSENVWNILVGVSHSFIVDTILVSKIRSHKKVIGLADFIKFVGGEMCYKEKWHTF
jgi:broad specificity phosphatase PhoE